MKLKLVIVAAAVFAAGSAGAQRPPVDSGVRVNLESGQPSQRPEQDPSQHYCYVDPTSGVVRIDGRLSEWRNDMCGKLKVKSPPVSCQANPALKLWRLYWTNTYWVYVPISSKSPKAGGLCPGGIETTADATPAWTDLPPRLDDPVVLAAK